MANAIGSLLVRLGLDDVEYRTGLTKAEYQAQAFQKKIEANFASLTRFIGTLGLGYAAVSFVKNTISSAAALDDLSDATGSSVASLSRLSNQAKIAGTDFEPFQALMLKMGVGLTEMDEESSKARHALQFLGITAKDPAEALQQIIVAMDKYAGGAGKITLARDLFQKGGPAFLASLKDMAELQDIAATRTAEQAAEADKLEKAWRRLSVESNTLKDALLTNIIPPLNAAIERFNVARTSGLGFFDSLRLSTNAGAKTGLFGGFVENLPERLSDARKKVEELQQQMEYASKRGFGADFIKPQLEKAKTELMIYEKYQKKIFDDIDKELGGPEAPKPQAKYTSKIPDDNRSRALDTQLKDLDRAIKAEEDLLRDREHFLQQYYQDDKLSITDFYTGRQNALDEAVSKQRAAYAEEQRIITAFRPKDEKERIANQEKLAEAIGKASRFETDAARAYIDMTFEKERATKEFQESVERLSISLAAARGDAVGAATRGFDLNNRRFRDQLTASGLSPADLDEDRKRTADKAGLTKATEDYQLVLDRLGISQQRIDILAQSGAIGEIESLNKRDALARQYISTLSAQADAYEKIAKSLDPGPARERALLEVERMRVGIEQLGEQTDGLAKKINAGLGDSFADHLAKIADGTESVRDGIKGILKDWTHMLNQMAAKEAGTMLFGKGGGLSGIGGWLASLFSGGAGASAGGGWTSGYDLPAFAMGTNYAPGGPARVGEHGPEEVWLPRGSVVVPNYEVKARARRATNHYTTINVLPGASRQTADQAMLAYAREASRSAYRNG